jgi:hypothetical protein
MKRTFKTVMAKISTNIIAVYYIVFTNVNEAGIRYRYSMFSTLLEFQLSTGDGWYPNKRLNPPHRCACPKPGPGFPMSYVMVFFMFNELR